MAGSPSVSTNCYARNIFPFSYAGVATKTMLNLQQTWGRRFRSGSSTPSFESPHPKRKSEQ